MFAGHNCSSSLFQKSSVLGSVAIVLVMTRLAMAQVVIPTDPKFPAPDGFSFQGKWQCADSSFAATLEVVGPEARERNETSGFSHKWTEVTETDHDRVGHYFMGYDRDKQQFVILDADDPAYAAYKIAGWRDNDLILTSVKGRGQSFPEHRFVYQLQNADEFHVIMELRAKISWIVHSSFNCQRTP